MKSIHGGPTFDVVVIGGGPAGSTTALVLARKGLRVLLAERDEFPRFHIGESLLPRNTELFRELGLEDKLRSIPHTNKHGVELALGHESDSSFFSFEDCLGALESHAFNVERAPFDRLLLDEAERAGAVVVRGTAVREPDRIQSGDCRITVGGDSVQSKFLVDASGQGTFLGKHLGLRSELKELRKISYFGHFVGVERRPGKREGYPTIVMMKDSWFWIIPIDAERTSVGVVMSRYHAHEVNLPSNEVLLWAISRCPAMARRMANAEPVDSFHVAADYSYKCRPCAGDGYFLVGDAATFLDPVFSTGVCLAMMSAVRAAEELVSVIRDGTDPDQARRSYTKYLDGSSAVLFRFVRNYYSHSFRELLLREVGPFGVHKAIVSILAGNVFPSPSFRLRWRLGLFEIFFRLQSRFPVAPRRGSFGLLEDPVPAKNRAE